MKRILKKSLKFAYHITMSTSDNDIIHVHQKYGSALSCNVCEHGGIIGALHEIQPK